MASQGDVVLLGIIELNSRYITDTHKFSQTDASEIVPHNQWSIFCWGLHRHQCGWEQYEMERAL
jgi:hypothetical protein